MPAAKNSLEEMDWQLRVIRETLKKASDRQKSYADLHWSSWVFKAGDRVFLGVKPKRSFLRLGKYKKLAYRYYGPWSL